MKVREESENVGLKPNMKTIKIIASSPAFIMMHSAYKLNKLGDNIQT